MSWNLRSQSLLTCKCTCIEVIQYDSEKEGDGWIDSQYYTLFYMACTLVYSPAYYSFKGLTILSLLKTKKV